MTTKCKPLTSQPLSLADKMPFGKYAGMTIGDLISRDPNYVAWAIKTIGSFILDEDAAVVYKRRRFW
ncbi:MAG: hypothetical protein AAF564_19095 [Bacteroidota bacterium]